MENDDTQALQAEEDMMVNLQSGILEHHLPIMALGSGRTSLQDKFCSVMFAMMLEAGNDEASLASFVQGIVAGTFDLGVEFSLSKILPTEFRTLFPWFESQVPRQDRPNIDSDLLQDDGFDAVPDEEPQVSLSLENMLSVPGPLHILHNATSFLITQLPYLGQAVPRLVALSRFLAGNISKQRLLATCFSSPVASQFKRDFSRFHARVNEGRWGSVAFAIPEVLDLKGPLQRFWNIQAFNHDSGNAPLRQQAADDSGPRVDYINETIESHEFWAQLLALDRLFTVVRELFEWLESCPCHYKRKAPPHDPAIKKRWQRCPLRGRRLPEIACGVFFEIVNDLCLANAARLFLELPESVTEDCRAACLLDFEHGRGHLTFHLTLKMSCFLEPPLLLFGLAHYDPEKPDLQREVLQRCLASDSPHPLMQKLREQNLLEEAKLFVEGEDLRLLDNLDFFISSFRFAWGTERKVEGGHAQVNMYAGGRRNRTEATDSLALRLFEIKRVLVSADVTSFLECVQVARNPQKLVAKLGLARHPSCSFAKSGWDPIFRKIVYHADPFSLYNASRPELFAAKVFARARARHEAVLDQADEPDLSPEFLEMHHQLALRHLKRQLESFCKNQDSRMLFSCKMPGAALTLLFQCLAPNGVQETLPPPSGSTEEVAMQAASDAVAPVSYTDALVAQASHTDLDTVFFRIVSCGLSRAKLAAPVDFQSSDVGVVLLKNAGPVEAVEGPEHQHKSYRVETSGVTLGSRLAGVSEVQTFPLVLSLSSLTLAQLRSFDGWQESTSDVQVDADSGVTCVCATAPIRVMEIRRDLPLADRSMYELAEQLCNDGWECVVARTSALRTGHSKHSLTVLFF